MKITRRIIAAMQVLLLFAGLIFSVSAAGEVTPRYNNTVTVTTSGDISSGGLMSVTNRYIGISGTTTKAVITTYIEKKVLGLFWTRVDIGTTNDEWVDTVYDYTYSISHTTQLSSKGTYRATVTYEIYGIGGSPDVIVKTLEKTY